MLRFKSDTSHLKSNLSRIYQQLEEEINTKIDQLNAELSAQILNAQSDLSASIQGVYNIVKANLSTHMLIKLNSKPKNLSTTTQTDIARMFPRLPQHDD